LARRHKQTLKFSLFENVLGLATPPTVSENGNKLKQTIHESNLSAALSLLATETDQCAFAITLDPRCWHIRDLGADRSKLGASWPLQGATGNQSGTSREPSGNQSGTNREPARAGSRLVPDWFPDGSRLVPGWFPVAPCKGQEAPSFERSAPKTRIGHEVLRDANGSAEVLVAGVREIFIGGAEHDAARDVPLVIELAPAGERPRADSAGCYFVTRQRPCGGELLASSFGEGLECPFIQEGQLRGPPEYPATKPKFLCVGIFSLAQPQRGLKIWPK